MPPKREQQYCPRPGCGLPTNDLAYHDYCFHNGPYPKERDFGTQVTVHPDWSLEVRFMKRKKKARK